MPRKNLVLVTLFVFFSAVSFSQSANEKAIRQVLATQETEWNSGQVENFMTTYWNNDSLVFIGKKGLTYGWNETLKNYKKAYPDKTAMGKLSFTIYQVKPLSADYYFVTGKFHLERTIGNLEGYFTLLFRKINGQWKIVADHTS